MDVLCVLTSIPFIEVIREKKKMLNMSVELWTKK